ncbi:MAG: signal transduction histidine kinase [Psychroserpens sp.]|jgi:signal transduction histidine kinase
MQKTPLQFKISSALKNIIGSDLISDDFIAVFELVKNSYDAHATKVEITFENIYSNNAKIIIKDNGKGMNYDDLINKWLFVAYSAKREGTEEDSYDYRNKIKVKRAYAGAKGIGRFSCDRLGRELYLETIKDEVNNKVETLLTEWDKFEGNLKEEFIDISVIHETIPNSNYNINCGTVLEITKLKSDWDRAKFLDLKNALAKLINPNTQNKEDVFEILLCVKDEQEEDSNNSNYNNIVNGKVQNLIFETLDLKTTKLISTISENNPNEIQTALYEGGKLVYKIYENNPFEKLSNVECEIYYLNRSAKSTFTRRMGVEPVNYGHIYVYKNGIRIYPYGDRSEDPLKMDNRKAQGRTRYLGTREVIGYIGINDPNENLRETTSRGDGLLKTKEYFELIEWFYLNIKRIEKYIIDIVDWGNFLSDDDFINFNNSFSKGEGEKQEFKNVNENLIKLIETLSSSKQIKSVELSPNILEILEQKSEKSVQKSLKNISETIINEKFDKVDVLAKIREASKKLEKLKKSKDEAEEEAFEKLIRNEELEDTLEKEIKKGSWQGALIGTDKERIIGLQHQIFHSSSRINRNIKLLLKHLKADSIDDKTRKHLSIMSLESAKINSIANFVTKANFNLKASEIERDIVEFMAGYLKEIYISDDRIIDSQLKIDVQSEDFRYIKEIRPLELTTLLDIFISNTEKKETKASKIFFKFYKKKNKLVIEIADDGKRGIEKENLSEIFKLGYTTTNGTGIGLYQAMDIVKKMEGEISVESKKDIGTTFTITI